MIKLKSTLNCIVYILCSSKIYFYSWKKKNIYVLLLQTIPVLLIVNTLIIDLGLYFFLYKFKMLEENYSTQLKKKMLTYQLLLLSRCRDGLIWGNSYETYTKIIHGKKKSFLGAGPLTVKDGRWKNEFSAKNLM